MPPTTPLDCGREGQNQDSAFNGASLDQSVTHDRMLVVGLGVSYRMMPPT